MTDESQEKSSGNSLFNRSKKPAIVVKFENESPKVDSINKAFKEKFQVREKPNDIDKFIEPLNSEKDAFLRFLEKIRNGKDITQNLKITVNNQKYEYELQGTPLDENNWDKFYIFFTDITDRKKRENQIKSLHEATLDLMKARSQEEISSITVKIAREALNFENTVLRTYTDENILKPLESSGNTGDTGKIRSLQLDQNRPEVKAFRSGKLVYNSQNSSKSAIHVPVENYGVLSVFEDSGEKFNSSDIELIRLLVSATSFALKSLRQENHSIPDSATELKLHSDDPKLFISHIAQELNCKCRVESVSPSKNRGETYYMKLEGVKHGKALDFLQKLDRVEECKIIESDNLFRVKTNENTLFSVIFDLGGVVKNAVADSNGVDLTLQITEDVDLSRLFEALEDNSPGWNLVKKKSIESADNNFLRTHEVLRDKLTEKQMDAMKTAYNSGYYEYPRDSTAEEIASSLGISDSTLFQHLQAAQKKLIEECLEPVLNSSYPPNKNLRDRKQNS